MNGSILATVIYDIVQPSLLILFQIAATAALGWLAAKVRQKFQVDIEAKYRDSLHQALTTGVQLALERVGGMVRGSAGSGVQILPAPVDSAAVAAEAAAYAQRSVPDAIGALRPSAGILEQIARAKLQGMLAGAAR